MLPVMWACIMFFMSSRCNALRKMRYFAHVFFIGAKEITTMQEKHHRSLTVSFIVAIAFFMQFLDTTAVNTAIPTMAASFGTDVIHKYGHNFVCYSLGGVYSGERMGCRQVWHAQGVFVGCGIFYHRFGPLRDVAEFGAVRGVQNPTRYGWGYDVAGRTSGGAQGDA